MKRGETYVKLGDGSRGMLPKDWLARYGSLAAMGEAHGESLRFASCQALMLDAMLAEQDGKVDRPFKQLRDKLRSFTGIAPIEEPEGFGGELRHYQREGLGWLEFLRDFRFGGCLADDMGLGKTIQVLALLERRRKRRLTKDETRAPSLVVVPKSLIFNWMDEAARFTPNLKVLNYTGLGRRCRLFRHGRCDRFTVTVGKRWFVAEYQQTVLPTARVQMPTVVVANEKPRKNRRPDGIVVCVLFDRGASGAATMLPQTTGQQAQQADTCQDQRGGLRDRRGQFSHDLDAGYREAVAA